MIEEIDEPFTPEEEEAETDFRELLEDKELTTTDKAKLKKMLAGEVFKGDCPSCGKLAVRIFQPRKKFDSIMKKHGIAGVMKECHSEVINERILVDMPSFNVILTGKHREVDSYSLGYTGYNFCKTGVLVTDNPRGLVWHLFSHMRAVKMACLMNGVSYDEVKAWFDALPMADATYLIPNVIDFAKVSDQDAKLNDGPWYVGWINTDNIHRVIPFIFAADTGGDPLWDTCVDPQVGDNMSISYTEYSTKSDGDNLIDVARYDLIMRKVYSSTEYHAVAEPANNAGKFLSFEVGITKDAVPESKVFARWLSTVPTKYWSVEASRFRPGLNAERDSTITDLEKVR